MTGGDSAWKSVGQIPTGYRPKANAYVTSTNAAGAYGVAYVQTNGNVEMRHFSNSTYTYYFCVALDV